jgi:ribosomal-protein-serine acetyltransferase
MSKTCNAFVEYAFSQLNLNRIEIKIASGNYKSRKIPPKIGFQEEGVLRHSEWFIDRYFDKVIYGILREEWELINKPKHREVLVSNSKKAYDI